MPPQPAPADELPEVSLRDRLLRVYCRVLVFLAIYVFSTGPFYWACYEGLKYAAEGAGVTDLPLPGVVYYPIALACRIDAVDRWFDWYVSLWI
ncbi:MAG: hypothetical protein KY476_18350 [Planctomycetes bacterium]|nr:hypothetical protein [Planctomycetota bacterium]